MKVESLLFLVRDLLTEGIPVIDLLEILHSTGKVGVILNLDQSSVSRIYRQVDDMLNLNITKLDGVYKPMQNIELLNNLRSSSQALRLCSKDYPVRVFVKPLSTLNHNESFQCIDLVDNSFGVNKGLRLLKQKAIDVFIADGFEVLPEHWENSQQSIYTTQEFIIIRLCDTSIQLASHPEHPLHYYEKLNGREFWSYPSVAVSNNLFPRLSRELTARGLWQDHYDLKKYTVDNWQGKSKDRKHLVYVSDFEMKKVSKLIPLKFLNYDLGLKSCEIALIHRDNSENEYLNNYIASLKDLYASDTHI